MLNNQPTIILTGASKGLGLATLKILLKANANVVAVARTESADISALARTYPGAMVFFKGDVSKDEDNKAAVDLAMQSFMRLDALILNAGTLDPLGRTSAMAGPERLAAYKSLFDVNFFSLVSITAHALPYLKETTNKDAGAVPGRVVLVSSGAATGGVAGWGAYSASKAALNSLARTLGNEEPDVVTVAVRPGVVGTDMQAAIRAQGPDHMLPKELERFMGLHERGELLPPHLPGGVLAGLALKAAKDLSGTFVSWDADEMNAYRMEKAE